MLNPKLIASGAGLFGLGAIFGWAFTADRMERKVRDALADFEDVQTSLRKKTRHVRELETRLVDLEDELDAVKQEQRIANAFAEESESPETPTEEIESGGEIEEVQEPEGEEFGQILGETEDETRTNLQRLIDTYVGTDEATEEYVERAVVSSATIVPPFVISRDKFSWDEEEGDDYSKITLSFFQGHNVLLDDADEPLDDIENYVGWRNLRRFGDESGDPEVVFIRNRRLETDFEVVKKDDDELPTHVRYGMGKEEFLTNKAAGLIRFREEDV